MRKDVPRKADARQDRLKLKLRENLKRRKVQERARADAEKRGDEKTSRPAAPIKPP